MSQSGRRIFAPILWEHHAHASPLWPTPVISDVDYAALRACLHVPLTACMRRCRLDEWLLDDLCRVYLPLAAWVDRMKGRGALVLGVNGAQGSGKSTLCEFLTLVLRHGYGHRVVGFSIDDLYKTRAERTQLAAGIHPLLETRGVPGTHDVELGLALIDQLITAGPDDVTRIPSFDKALDERRPESDWPAHDGPTDIIILEGWCVGAKPQPESDLTRPVNTLEASEDPDGVWRHHVNMKLELDYSRLFARLDKLIMLKVPGMESVYQWRAIQERKLAAALDPDGQNRLMDDTALRRFIMHYERLTCAMLQEMPQRADLVLELDTHHRFTHLGVN